MINQQTREEDILQYMPLVEKVVNGLRIKSREYERGDFINFGVIGLMDAMEKYDETKQVRFESYAYTRIRGAIIDEVRKTSPITRTGMDKLKAYYQAKEELSRELKRDPKEAEIAERLGMTLKQLDQIYDSIHQLSAVSLEKTIFTSDGTGTAMVDFIEDPEAPELDTALLAEEKKAGLMEAVHCLPEREQQILQLIYVEKMALKEIAYIFEVSVPRISQIHGKALVTMRDYLRRNHFD